MKITLKEAFACAVLAATLTGGIFGLTATANAATEAERDTLARIICAEAECEPYEGKVAVGNVVMNRCEQWGMTIEQVIFQKGQFAPISNGRYYNCTPDEACYKAADEALAAYNGDAVSVVGDSIYFCQGWFPWATYTGTIGGHNFFK